MDSLKLIIEADSSALKSQFQDIYTKVTTLVGQINSQSVDWDAILAGAISPAIVSSIAAMFATAIDQAMQFQDAVQAAANNTGSTTAASTQTMANNISDLVDTGAGSYDALSAPLAALMNNFQDSGAAGTASFAATEQAAEFAKTHGITDLTSFVENDLIPTFQAWGITTVPQVANAFAALEATVGQGNFTPQSLLTLMASGTPLAAAGASFDSTIATIQTASQNMPTSAVEDYFKAFVTGSGNMAAPFNILLLGMENGVKTLIQNAGGDIATAWTKGMTNLKGMSTTQQQLVVQGNVLQPGTVAAIDNVSIQKINAAEMDVQKIVAQIQSSGPGGGAPTTESNMTTGQGQESPLQQLQDEWNIFMKDLALDGKTILPTLVPLVKSLMTLFDALAKVLNPILQITLPPLIVLLDLLADVFNFIASVITTILSPFKDLANIMNTATGGISSLVKDLTTGTGSSITSLLKDLNPLSGLTPAAVPSSTNNTTGGSTSVTNYQQNNSYSAPTTNGQGQASTQNFWSKLSNSTFGIL